MFTAIAKTLRLGAVLPALLAVAAVLNPAPAGAEGGLPSFQKLVDEAPPGGFLLPEPGTYAGPVVVDKPLVIDGQGKVVIDNGGEGTVIETTSSNVQLRGLTIRGSGDMHVNLDAGLKVRGDFTIIKDNVFEDCLFGIDVQQANNVILRRNRIGSKDKTMGMRGDAIRLWYAHDALVEDNEVADARDVVIWYSERSKVQGNDIRYGRYGIHFMYSHDALVRDNRLYRNIVGIFSMYSNKIQLRENHVIESNGPSGMGIGLKETSGATLADNDLLGNAVGLYVDLSPDTPDDNSMTANRFAFNGTAVLFHSDWQGNVFTGNDFIGNHSQVVVRGGGTANRNVWQGNHWDVYRGFDGDGNGVGDVPFELHAYADRMWMDVPNAAFFRGSPVLELLDFLERLAPFSQPQLILRDEEPRLRRLGEAKLAAQDDSN